MSSDKKKYEWVSERLSDTIGQSCDEISSNLKKSKAEETVESVQVVRDNLKKIRALLRLTRDQAKDYKKQNALYRDAARKLLPVQISGSLVDAIDLIHKQYSEQLYKNAFTDLRKQLEDKKEAAIEAALNEDHILQEVEQNLEGECERLKEQFLSPVSLKTLASGIKKIYAQGKRASDKLAGSSDKGDLHDLQKRATYLKHQLVIIALIWPSIFDAWTGELQKLSDLLVTYEGLAQLSEYLEKSTPMAKTEDGTYLMHTLTEGHGEQLKKHAVLLAKKLYFMKPKDFIAYLETSWDAHHAEGEQKLIAMDKLGFN